MPQKVDCGTRLLSRRRTALTRGNGTHTGWYYGAGGTSPWLVSLYQIVTGGAGSLQVNYAYNPAGQIVQRTSSNDNYSWQGFVRTNRSYGVNDLNQYTSVGGNTQSYDARGNLTTSSGTAYGYTLQNRLTYVGDANHWFYHDAAGRLDVEVSPSLCTLFDYGSVRPSCPLL